MTNIVTLKIFYAAVQGKGLEWRVLIFIFYTMFFKLLALFTIVPLVELYLLIKVGAVLGALPTIVIVVGTGALGAWFARRQGFQVFLNIRREFHMGHLPADQLMEGVLLLAAGIVLITPGILTDITGLLLLIPSVRSALLNKLKDMLRRRLEMRYGYFQQDDFDHA